MEAPDVSLLCLRGVVLFFGSFKSVHRSCGLAPGVGKRDGQANEFQSNAVRDPAMTE
jgi:hypothetical protein